MKIKVTDESFKQRTRRTALEGVLEGKRTISSASRMMNLSETQTRRLLKMATEQGLDATLKDRRRGNNKTKIPQAIRDKISALYEDKYSGFNFCHYTSMLNDFEGNQHF